VEDNCIGVALQEVSDGHPEHVTSCTVSVRFAPTSTGANKNAVLTVLDPTSGTPADAIAVALSGDANP
jgi:hypothetical protein